MRRTTARRESRAASQRQLRVGELVRHTLSEILTRAEVHDPEIEDVAVTVPEVQMSPDLKRATVFVMPLGGAGADTVVAALERNRKFLRGEVARRVKLRFAPELVFRLDTSFGEAEKVEEILRSPAVQRDLGDGGDGDA